MAAGLLYIIRSAGKLKFKDPFPPAAAAAAKEPCGWLKSGMKGKWGVMDVGDGLVG